MSFVDLHSQIFSTGRSDFLVGFGLCYLFGAMRLLIRPFLHLLLKLSTP